jgi:hypothetical protein
MLRKPYRGECALHIAFVQVVARAPPGEILQAKKKLRIRSSFPPLELIETLWSNGFSARADDRYEKVPRHVIFIAGFNLLYEPK